MSLERIDQYIRELEAIKYYDSAKKERDKGYLADPYNRIDLPKRIIPSLARILSINSVLTVNIDDQIPDYTADLILNGY